MSETSQNVNSSKSEDRKSSGESSKTEPSRKTSSAKSEKSRKSDTSEKSRKSSKSEKSGKSNVSDKPVKSDSSEKFKISEKSSTSGTFEVSEKSIKSETSEKSGKSEKSKISETLEKSETSLKSGTSEKSKKSKTSEKSGKSEKSKISETLEKSETSLKSGTSEKSKKSKTSERLENKGFLPTVVLTGFGPFQNCPINPSWEVAKELKKMGMESEGVDLVIQQFPVSYECVLREIPLIWEECEPHLVVHSGASSAACEIKLEKLAHRSGYCKPDIDGKCPPGGICDTGVDEIFETELDLFQVCDKINEMENVPVSTCVSLNCGRYVCEFTYYASLSYNKAKTVFVHLPFLDNPYSLTELAECMKYVILYLVEQIKIPENGFRKQGCKDIMDSDAVEERPKCQQYQDPEESTAKTKSDITVPECFEEMLRLFQEPGDDSLKKIGSDQNEETYNSRSNKDENLSSFQRTMPVDSFQEKSPQIISPETDLKKQHAFGLPDDSVDRDSKAGEKKIALHEEPPSLAEGQQTRSKSHYVATEKDVTDLDSGKGRSQTHEHVVGTSSPLSKTSMKFDSNRAEESTSGVKGHQLSEQSQPPVKVLANESSRKFISSTNDPTAQDMSHFPHQQSSNKRDSYAGSPQRHGSDKSIESAAKFSEYPQQTTPSTVHDPSRTYVPENHGEVSGNEITNFGQDNNKQKTGSPDASNRKDSYSLPPKKSGDKIEKPSGLSSVPTKESNNESSPQRSFLQDLSDQSGSKTKRIGSGEYPEDTSIKKSDAKGNESTSSKKGSITDQSGLKVKRTSTAEEPKNILTGKHDAKGIESANSNSKNTSRNRIESTSSRKGSVSDQPGHKIKRNSNEDHPGDTPTKKHAAKGNESTISYNKHASRNESEGGSSKKGLSQDVPTKSGSKTKRTSFEEHPDEVSTRKPHSIANESTIAHYKDILGNEINERSSSKKRFLHEDSDQSGVRMRRVSTVENPRKEFVTGNESTKNTFRYETAGSSSKKGILREISIQSSSGTSRTGSGGRPDDSIRNQFIVANESTVPHYKNVVGNENNEGSTSRIKFYGDDRSSSRVKRITIVDYPDEISLQKQYEIRKESTIISQRRVSLRTPDSNKRIYENAFESKNTDKGTAPPQISTIKPDQSHDIDQQRQSFVTIHSTYYIPKTRKPDESTTAKINEKDNMVENLSDQCLSIVLETLKKYNDNDEFAPRVGGKKSTRASTQSFRQDNSRKYDSVVLGTLRSIVTQRGTSPKSNRVTSPKRDFRHGSAERSKSHSL